MTFNERSSRPRCSNAVEDARRSAQLLKPICLSLSRFHRKKVNCEWLGLAGQQNEFSPHVNAHKASAFIKLSLIYAGPKSVSLFSSVANPAHVMSW